MKESFWGIFVLGVGIAALLLIVFFQSVTNTDQHNSLLLEEVTEAAMKDSIDYAEYRYRSREYEIVFYSINEAPPKVSVGVRSGVSGSAGDEQITFDLNNRVNAILESPY